MSLLEEITPSPRKVMTLFYLVDTSSSMRGSRIGTLNAAMEESIPLLKEVADGIPEGGLGLNGHCPVSVPELHSICSFPAFGGSLRAAGSRPLHRTKRERKSGVSRETK